MGRLHSPCATAEIEADEGEIVSIDTPTMPQRDLKALLQEATPLPLDFCQPRTKANRSASSLQFVSSFISVAEEKQTLSCSGISDQHVRELLQEYHKNEQGFDLNACDKGGGEADCDGISEKYEKGLPAHGDKMFHQFMCQIQKSPGQILR